jgi:ribosomal protein L7/L12
MDSEAVTQLIARHESIVRENEHLILEITRVKSEHQMILLRYNACFRPDNQEYVALFTKVIGAESKEKKKEVCDEIRTKLCKKKLSLIQQIKIVKNITGMNLSDSRHFIAGYSNEIIL